MAWNQPGKKGDNERDPWKGRRPSDSDRDTENFIERLKQSMGGMFGSGGGGNDAGEPVASRIALWVGVLVAVWLVFSCVQLINETQRGVVLRFGQFSRILTPGPNLKWPWPIETVQKVDATKARSTSDTVRLLTNDENIVLVEFSVQYRVSNPRLFLYGDREPEATLKQAAESAVREVMGGSKMDDILIGQRAELAAKARLRLQTSLDMYRTGLIVSEFNIQNARPPQEVKDAFDDANRAMQDKDRLVNEARAYASQVVPVARGEGARVRTAAEGYKEAVTAAASGNAQRFSLLDEQYRKAPEVTRKRLYLDTMQAVLSATPKVVSGKGNNVLYLPMDRGAVPTIPEPTGASSAASPVNLPAISAALPDRVSAGGAASDADARPGRPDRSDGRNGGDR